MKKIIEESRLKNILKTTNLKALIAQTETTTSRGKVICPWCHDTQSFQISERHQSYHCFCCGRSGNAIRWMMERHGLGFKAAAEKLEANAPDETPRGTSHE
jgi:DNA primase